MVDIDCQENLATIFGRLYAVAKNSTFLWMPSIGSRIREAYEKAGLNRFQLSQKLGVVYHQILRWEKDAQPRPDTLVEIAKICNVDVGWLMGVVAHEEPRETNAEAKSAAEEFLSSPFGQTVPEDFRDWIFSLDFQKAGVRNTASLFREAYLDEAARRRTGEVGIKLNKPLGEGKRPLVESSTHGLGCTS